MFRLRGRRDEIGAGHEERGGTSPPPGELVPPLLSLGHKLPAPTPAGTLHLVAIAAIDRLIAARQKRYLGLIAAACAGHGVHLARLAFARTPHSPSSAPAPPRLLASRPAGRTTRRCIRQSPAGKKLLLANGEGKLLTTVATIQNLIHKSHTPFLFSRANAR